jgi:ketosteroid isomerase-like protein
MVHRNSWLLLAAALLLPACAASPRPPATGPDAVAEVHEATRRYDEALRRADAEAAGRFWANEFIFVNPEGRRLTRADRLANLRTGRTAFDSLAPAPGQEEIRVYGDVAVHRTLLTIGGRYSGQVERGQFRALVVWVRRDGRWQQVANQLTSVHGP